MIKNILNKLASKEKNILSKEILSPFVKEGNSIQLRVDGIIYTLKTPKSDRDGFGIFKAKDTSRAKFLRDADQIEKSEYLNLLPKTSLILVFNSNKWFAYPYNSSSFKQQFGLEAQMVPILLVDNAEFLDVVDARFDGINFWFNGVKFLNGAEKKEELRERIRNFNYSGGQLLDGLTPEEKITFNLACEFHKETNKSHLEKRLEVAFNNLEAKVDKFIERGSNLEVQWRDNLTKKTFTSVLEKENFSVITAGICLSGADKKFDLQSLITVCREGVNRGAIYHIGAGGMDEQDYWDRYGNGD